jgi:hypothetical protein
MARFTFASLFLASLTAVLAQPPTESPIYAPTTAPVYGPSVSPTDAPTNSVDDTVADVGTDIAGADFSVCGSEAVIGDVTGEAVDSTNIIAVMYDVTIINPTGDSSECIETTSESAVTSDRRALLLASQSVLSVDAVCAAIAPCAAGVGMIGDTCQVCENTILIQNGDELITSAPTVKSGKGGKSGENKSGKGTSAPTMTGATKAPTVKSGKGGNKSSKTRMRV